MPTYEYYCEHCDEKFEQYHVVDERDQGTCPKCGGHCKRVFTAVPIIFRGSGWYVTDNAKGASPSTGTAAKPDGQGNGSGNGNGKHHKSKPKADKPIEKTAGKKEPKDE